MSDTREPLYKQDLAHIDAAQRQRSSTRIRKPVCGRRVFDASDHRVQHKYSNGADRVAQGTNCARFS